MFKWLTDLIRGNTHRQIPALVQEVEQKIEKCQTEASLGNHDATMKLRDINNTLEAESLKMIRKVKIVPK